MKYLFRVLVAILFALPTNVFADTTFSGAISGNETWTKAASPYVINFVSIPSGASLTIEPGAIIKAQLGTVPFTVDGTLTVGASSGEQVILTSINDDTVGGDTNRDGSTTIPAAGNWNRIVVNSGAHVSIINGIIRYGGATPYNAYTGGYFTLPLIENTGGSLALDHVELMHSGYSGLTQSAGSSTITNSLFADIARFGIYQSGGSVSVASTTFDTMEKGIFTTAGVLDLSASAFMHLAAYAAELSGSAITFRNHAGNTGTRGINLYMILSSDLTLPKDGISYVANYLTVPSGLTLAILPGAVVKIPSTPSSFIVDGTLVVGTPNATEKVYITALTDDTLGGDTNGDGVSTTPSSGSWRSIVLNPGSGASIVHTVIRYGGASPYNAYTGGPDWLPAIRNNGGTLTLSHDTLVDDGNYALLQLSGTSTITDSEIARSDRYGIWSSGGAISIHNSSIHDNATYGVFNVSNDVIDATNNWWGSPDGPLHPIDLFDLTQGSGDQVSVNVSFKPFQVLYGIPQGCTVNCYSNVLFLPGVAGSRLYEVSELDSERCGSDTGSSYFKRWLPVTNCDNTKLLLDVNGQSKNHIVTKDVIDEAGGLPNIYASFLADLRSWKFTDSLMADYSVIPYDWRLSIGDILNKGKINPNGYIDYTQNLAPNETPFILSEFLRMASSSRTHKVTIIAHSNGGLIAKALMLQLRALGKENLVDKIVFVAVPEVGTPDAVATLLHGSDLGPLGVISDKRQTREISQNMPTAYSLLPSDAYYQTSISSIPVATFGASGLYANERAMYGIGIGNSTELNEYLLGLEGRMMPDYSNLNAASIANPALLSLSHFTHSELDAWIPASTTKMIEIAGWGEYTIAGLQYTSEAYCARSHTETQFLISKNVCDEYAQKKILKNTYTVNGDETVVADSAHYLSDKNMSGVERWWLDIHSYNNAGFLGSNKNRYHKDILEVASLRNFIKNQIASTTSVLAYISTTKPSSLTDVIIYDLHSPLSLNLYDNDGRHTGISTTTGLIEENIPGTRYKEVGDTKYIIADAGIAQHLILKGYASGSFSLGVQKLTGDTVVASTTFSAIPSSTSTLVTLDLPINTDLISSTSSLKIDFNGDGVIDAQMASKPNQENVYDITPPEVELSFNQVTQSLQVQGFDSVSLTTVATTASSTKVTDQAGNTTELLFSKYNIKPKKIELVISEIKQNGIIISTSTIPLTYKWNILTTGTSTMIKTLASYAKSATSSVETHYRPRKGITIVMTTPLDLDDNDDGDEVDVRPTKEKLNGVHVIKLKVSGGKIYISY